MRSSMTQIYVKRVTNSIYSLRVVNVHLDIVETIHGSYGIMGVDSDSLVFKINADVDNVIYAIIRFMDVTICVLDLDFVVISVYIFSDRL